MTTYEVEPELPCGVAELDPVVFQPESDKERVRCFVRGCSELLRRPRRGDPGESCPLHGIRCHFSNGSATYSYVDPRRNLIIDADLAARAVFGHPFKHDRNRFGTEKSEDALSWNVFRSLQYARLLHRVAQMIVPGAPDDEPQLFLWGLHCGATVFEPWNLLIAARNRFESNLPVDRPKTEPDIALWMPGRYLILIEAKFTSPNPYYYVGPRKDRQSLTKDELVSIYRDDGLLTLNYDRAQRAERIPYQLWRNMIFAEWMTLHAGAGEIGYHANLTRTGTEQESQSEFRVLFNPGHQDRFAATSWEQIENVAAEDGGSQTLCRYLQAKSAELTKAFHRCGGKESRSIDQSDATATDKLFQ